MSNKSYLFSGLAMAAILGLALATPALAATTTNSTSSDSDEGGPGYGYGRMMSNFGQLVRGIVNRGGSIVGTVTAVNGTTFTINSRGRMMDNDNATSSATTTTYTVDTSKAQIFKNGATTTVVSIMVGDTVMIRGTVSGTNITATVIRDGLPMNQKEANDSYRKHATSTPSFAGIQGNGQPIVAGSITTISGNTVIITNQSNVTYTIDATNAKIEAGKKSGSLSNLTVGDKVIVQGAVSGTNVTASLIIDQTKPGKNNANATSTERHGLGLGEVFGGLGNFFRHLFGF